MRTRPLVTVLTALALATSVAVPAHAASAASPGQGLEPAPRPAPALLEECTGTAPVVCRFDVDPGRYDVTVRLGGPEAAHTAVWAEARRLMVPATAMEAGGTERATFTVDVRDPEGEPTGGAGPGEDGLTLVLDGPAPGVEGIGLAPAPADRPDLYLLGDSTVTDQGTHPYTGWGQLLPAHYRHGLAVANYADSGESSGSVLAHPALLPTVEQRIGPGDTVLYQVGHNDKQTSARDFRANLTEAVTRIRATGAEPVLVTPVVRRWFTGDRLNEVGLIVNGLGVDLPAEMRAVAAAEGTALIDLTEHSRELVEGLGPEAAKDLYLTRQLRDDTHLSIAGAAVMSDLVAAELRAQGLVPDRVEARSELGRAEHAGTGEREIRP
ncbi:rhamnogalacturonan acetylesterase [Nocardiopsis aegyptia]|uniref:Lysophospholipase L1-like esterase n=1 Tax=Nocardiopsis aegyptia TaxID=220378 RepID=A0A7Z0ESL2_9ACTN|nr:rhamnogalacturonan acetylesterase [Nocardiopsis aegyptia]NYJ37559.1 lysophospholipase L1-like esterase [Nocardiopsis aegyptia]